MTCMTTTSSNVSANQSSVSQSCEYTPASQRISCTSTGSQGNVRSTDNSASDSPRVSRPRLSRGSCHTPDPCLSQLASSSSQSSQLSAVAFVDHDSGVVISSLYTASGERITTHEFQSKSHRVLAPTLYLVIPSTSTGSTGLPNFALTLPSPISSTSSPVLLPPPSPFTRASYLAAAALAPPSQRVPSLPHQRCPHMLFRLTAAPPQHNRCCALCSTQQLACEIWWGSRGSMLCAPQLPAAASTPTTRAVYYALGLPLGRLECACVDWDVIDAISFMRQTPRCTSSSCGISVKSKPVDVVTRAPAPSRILRVFVRRARRVLSAPAKVPMVPIPVIPRRRVIVRP
ncbi:hypothetical protein EDB85DRAFT_1923065 [Lactarius pseudohatsudake]|nr:hypothetical protein EDB85DRAFT_1923065 [Lactarius pseudohatsudake]